MILNLNLVEKLILKSLVMCDIRILTIMPIGLYWYIGIYYKQGHICSVVARATLMEKIRIAQFFHF